MPICKITALNKSFQKDDNLIRAIVNCNIEIKKGECVAISGSKASGKTTLLRILGGLERPTSGEVYINHKNITNFTDDQLAKMRRNEIGYLFQNDSLIPELTVHENIIIPSILARKKYDKTYYQELIEWLNIGELLNHYPKQLAKNQLACVTYARALINKPNIILVDDFTDNYDYQMNKELLDFLLNMVYYHKKTLIMVTNDSEIDLFVDHIIRLKDGEIVEDRRIS